MLGLLAAAASLTSHGALDRLIRGRIWIAVIAFALIGIVTLQLLVLQLNANVGRALVREAQLQRENAAYSIENSELAGGERVESKAGRLGMQLVPAGALRFLTADPRADLARAAAALSTPVNAAGSTSTSSSTSTSTSTSGSGEAGASALTASAGAAATGAAGEQAPAGGQAQSAEQAPSGEQAPAGETTAPASTQAAASQTGAAAPAGEASAPASAPATAAGGTEPAGAG